MEREEDVCRPVGTVARLKTGEVVIKFKTHGSTMNVREEFVGDDKNATGVAMVGETFMPNTKAMRGNIGAAGHVLVKLL